MSVVVAASDTSNVTSLPQRLPVSITLLSFTKASTTNPTSLALSNKAFTTDLASLALKEASTTKLASLPLNNAQSFPLPRRSTTFHT
jgi:hypothetical protein